MKPLGLLSCLVLITCIGGTFSTSGCQSDSKEILLLAGKKSHGYGVHEHRAGAMLLAKCLNESGLNVNATVVTEGRLPEIESELPDAVVMYCDGLHKHIGKEHRDEIQKWVDVGVGVSCLHFATEVEADVMGRTFLDWIGGYFEVNWSVNPHWDATFNSFPEHPVSQGVQPFTIRDEWYYHLRFRPEMEGITPILTALPPVETLTKRKNINPGRTINPSVLAAVEAGQQQILAWVYERPGGGRGFGFTGGHFHKNWQHDDFRKVVLNAIAWTAHVEIPPFGVTSNTPTAAELKSNQDYPKLK